MKTVVRLGAGSGFWGDALDPAVELVERGELDYLGMDYLAELTMALLQRQRQRKPDEGYIPDLVPHMTALLPLARDQGTRIVCNGGGANPRAGAERVRRVARDLGLAGTRVALVEGDDMLDRLDELTAAGIALTNTDTGEEDFGAIRDRVVAANVYTDCTGIIAALQADAHVVVAGRVSDNALFVGPIMHEFGWRHEPEYTDRICAAITVGHVVECAAAATGGMSSRFAEMPHMGRVGFPFVEFRADGSAVVSKLPGTGGRVDQFTIKEHLVYEVANPADYRMPDGIADFTRLELTETGPDRVRITGMGGKPPPEMLRVVIGYQDGWIGEAMAFFPWPDALARAEKARETMLERFDRMGLVADEVQFDYIGVNMLHGPAAPTAECDLNEVGLRVAVHTETREEAEKVRRACSNLWIMGPGGTSFGTPIKTRPVVAAWPTLVPRHVVRQQVEILEA
ncbi:MAG: acyclic terpene utilization AtuA family protein [Hyphomicrobiaceae bacterium]|nr:acyclic terpene utilization AtuA family protein [Hyphomicrobiaceae bacterium]